MGLPHVRSRRWTRAEYDRLIGLGVLHEDEPVELVGGDLVCKEPQAARHASAVLLVVEALRRSALTTSSRPSWSRRPTSAWRSSFPGRAETWNPARVLPNGGA